MELLTTRFSKDMWPTISMANSFKRNSKIRRKIFELEEEEKRICLILRALQNVIKMHEYVTK